MIGFKEQGYVMFGVGRLTTEGAMLENVPLCFNFRSGELGYQFSGETNLSRDDICFDTLATIEGQFASPWGMFNLKPKAQWTSFSTGGGSWNLSRTPLYEFLEDSPSWQYSWLRSNQTVEFETPYSFEETLFVGRCSDIHGGMKLDDDLQVVSRKSSISLLGKIPISDVYPLYCSALSVAAGASLRAHSHQTERLLTIFGNSYEPLAKSSQPLFYSGYPFRNSELEKQDFESVVKCALSKLSASPLNDGPGVLEILQFLEVRTSPSVSESRILSCFAFLETFCERHLKERDYPTLFGVSVEEAKALNRYRNDLIHNNLDPAEATRTFASRIRNNDPLRFQGIRRDVKGEDSIMALVYVLSLCDQQLLKWIKFRGLTQMYIPTDEKMLRLWQPEVGKKGLPDV